jgi:hypothetical protein
LLRLFCQVPGSFRAFDPPGDHPVTTEPNFGVGRGSAPNLRQAVPIVPIARLSADQIALFIARRESSDPKSKSDIQTNEGERGSGRDT